MALEIISVSLFSPPSLLIILANRLITLEAMSSEKLVRSMVVVSWEEDPSGQKPVR